MDFLTLDKTFVLDNLNFVQDKIFFVWADERGMGDYCLVHLPGQNIFCPGQYWNCPGQKFCPGLKSLFFTFKSHWIWIFLIEDKFSRLFQSESFILNDFCKQKMNFLTLDKTFVLDNFTFVQDKIFFSRADGRGISLSLQETTRWLLEN